MVVILKKYSVVELVDMFSRPFCQNLLEYISCFVSLSPTSSFILLMVANLSAQSGFLSQYLLHMWLVKCSSNLVKK